MKRCPSCRRVYDRDAKFCQIDGTILADFSSDPSIGQTIAKRYRLSRGLGHGPLGTDGRVWECNTGSNDIYVIDPATQQVVASFQVGPASQQIAFGFKGLLGPLAYVTVAGFNKVLVLDADPKRLRLLEEIEVGEAPNGIAANPQGTRLSVVHERSNDLRVIDTGTSRVIATVPVGRKPIRVVVSK